MEQTRDPDICRLTALDAAERLRVLIALLEEKSTLSQILGEAEKNLFGLDAEPDATSTNAPNPAKSRPLSRHTKLRLVN